MNTNYRNTEIQKYRNTNYRNTEIKITEIQKYKLQKCKNKQDYTNTRKN